MSDLAKNTIRARRWRRLQDAAFPLLSGTAIAAFTFGALSERIADRNDLLSDPLEAALLGFAFALGAFPRRWAVAARALIFVPTFFLYLTVFLGKNSAVTLRRCICRGRLLRFLLYRTSRLFLRTPSPAETQIAAATGTATGGCS